MKLISGAVSPVWAGCGEPEQGLGGKGSLLAALVGQSPGAVQAMASEVSRAWSLGWVCPWGCRCPGHWGHCSSGECHRARAPFSQSSPALCPARVGTGQVCLPLLLQLLCLPSAVPRTKSTVQGLKESACLKDQVCSNLTLSLG